LQIELPNTLAMKDPKEEAKDPDIEHMQLWADFNSSASTMGTILSKPVHGYSPENRSLDPTTCSEGSTNMVQNRTKIYISSDEM